MKARKLISKILIGLCAVSLIALIIVIFTGCTPSISSVSKNLTEYNIAVDYDDTAQKLACSEKVTYVNSSDTILKQICFHLYPNAFREDATNKPVSLANQHKAYPNGLSYGNIEITHVSVLHNTATYSESYDIAQPTSSDFPLYSVTGEDENILAILLAADLYSDNSIELEIQFEVNLPNVNHRFGYGENTTNLANFYPIACVYENGEFDTSPYNYNGDPFYSEMANYNVTLSAGKDYTYAHTGNLVEKTETDDKNVITLEAQAVRDFAIVLSKEFTVLSQMHDKTEVIYYYFSDENPALSLETAVKALKTFNEIIGTYPYKTLSVVEANFVHGGMEFPNLVYISNEITEETTYQQVIVHEIAHQWWYNLVGNSAHSYSWLDEGLTEYSTALFFELNPEYNVSKDTMISNAYTSYSLFVEIYSNVFKDFSTEMNRELSDYNTEQEYVYIAYVKGMLLFDSLREILGYDTFIKCLQNYFSQNIYQNVTPDDMIASFEKTSGRSLEGYFDAWIEGKIILLK